MGITTLLWGSALIFLAFGLHVALWRLAPPRRQTRALLLLFFGLLGAFLAATRFLPSTAWRGLPLPYDLASAANLVLFVTAITLAYVITYSAVEANSPSLVIILKIWRSEGLPPAAIEDFVSDDVLVGARIRDLERDGLITIEGKRLRPTAKGRLFVAIFTTYRAILGAGKGG